MDACGWRKGVEQNLADVSREDWLEGLWKNNGTVKEGIDNVDDDKERKKWGERC